MPSPISDNNAFNTLKNALDGLQYKQVMLSSNIANASTPGYQAREMDFRSVMSRLQQGQTDFPVEMSRTSAFHLDPRSDFDKALDPWVLGTTCSNGAPDVRQQMVAVSENSIQFSAVAQAMQQQLARYRTAIREGK